MKVTKAQSAENRQSILDAAARLYRERGLSGVGVADITRDAGLTHGSLYRHFENKDALVREACASAFDWTMSSLEGADDGALTGLAAKVAGYLSPQHRDHPGEGCLVAALAVDAARAGAELSEVFAQGIERNIERLARVIEGLEPGGTGQPSPENRARALHMLATMVGGLVVARATVAARPALSDEILATLREQLTSYSGAEQPEAGQR